MDQSIFQVFSVSQLAVLLGCAILGFVLIRFLPYNLQFGQRVLIGGIIFVVLTLVLPEILGSDFYYSGKENPDSNYFTYVPRTETRFANLVRVFTGVGLGLGLLIPRNFRFGFGGLSLFGDNWRSSRNRRLERKRIEAEIARERRLEKEAETKRVQVERERANDQIKERELELKKRETFSKRKGYNEHVKRMEELEQKARNMGLENEANKYRAKLEEYKRKLG